MFILRRRPLTFDDIVDITSQESQNVDLWLEDQINSGLISKVAVDGGETFYKLDDGEKVGK